MPAQLALLANMVIAAAYAAIMVAIVVPVVRAGQLRTNRLATTTALIFFSCAVGHALHAYGSWRAVVAAVSPHGTHDVSAGWGWPTALWDIGTATVGVYYWTLRRSYGVLLSRGALFVDPGQQRLLDEVEHRERLAADQAERHRATLAAVVDQSDDAITGTTLDGTVTAWNCGAERMFGYPAAEAIGAPATVLAAATDGVDRTTLLARVAAGERGIRYDAQVPHRNGTMIDVAVTLSPVFDNGTVVAVSAICRDVSATKRAEASQRAAEERAHQAQRMASLGQLAGGVAHDFNNLLGIILNFTAFAAEQTADNDSIQADLGQVRTAAERAVGLARQLLVFTRQDTIRPELLDVNASVAEAHAMLRRTIGEHIALIAVPAPTPLMVYADPGHLQQILVNLAVNARDAMPGGGTLVIEATTVDTDERPDDQATDTGRRYARILVSDTGCGMSPDVLARIFEPFYTTKPRGQGTGLGLATVHGIVAETGGRIDVDSEPGIGTTFRVYLPVAAVSHLPPTAPEASGAPRGHGQTVLVVEDETALGAAVARILNDHGYRALTAGGGQEALALDAAHGCDLLLTDIIMPDMSGRRVAELLQQRHPKLPVLYMSGYTDGLLGTSHLPDRAVAFIEKPFTAHHLLTEIAHILTAPDPAARARTPAGSRRRPEDETKPDASAAPTSDHA